MAKVLVEFINTCPTCVGYEEMIRKAAKEKGDQVEVKIYYAGKDYDYVRKYGMVTKGTMIINEKKKYDRLNQKTIEDAISDALKAGEE
ncbi:thioredoxin-like (seleno)protein SaoT [Tindallia californiensis]|uniref:Thioredoxin domain-containing protein n=1 Tax=Tindallia californiensis TaxID=159292 RepID=A0A1H3Q254_9FIRM|nr:thioredoxin-like (seleno)protein SaoT [Tindallia californiensis]SDZ07456.1 Thioredoxin domain-containing protein [Tindallia californiensis]